MGEWPHRKLYDVIHHLCLNLNTDVALNCFRGCSIHKISFKGDEGDGSKHFRAWNFNLIQYKTACRALGFGFSSNDKLMSYLCEKKITENKYKQIGRILIPATSYNLTLRPFVVTNYLHNQKLGQNWCLLVPWYTTYFSSSFCDQFICSMKQSKHPCMLQCVHMGRFIVRHWGNLLETLWPWSSFFF